MIAFVEMKDAWERDFIQKKLAGSGKLSFFEETAQGRIKELRETKVLAVFINSKLDQKLIAQMPFENFFALSGPQVFR